MKSPRLSRRRVSAEKKPSTAFSHEAEVGVKWNTQRAGQVVEYRDDDPETSCWRRFKTGMLGALAPEQWL